MYSYQQATEVLAAMEKELAIGNLFQTDAFSLAAKFADTIQQHELISEECSAGIGVLNEAVSHLNLEISDLKQERDDLVDRVAKAQERLEDCTFDFRTSERTVIRLKSVVEHLISAPY